MQKITLHEALQEILRQDNRYAPEAYIFIKESLDFTIRLLDKPTEGANRHVSASELLEGVRAYALEEYGPMSFTVLKTWGLNDTTDIGHVVFNLVRQGILGKTEKDQISDFAGGYDFHDVFRSPFLPRHNPPSTTEPTSPESRRTPASPHPPANDG